jgi:hypothetical protein
VLANTIHARYANEKMYSLVKTRVKVQIDAQLMLNGCVVTKTKAHTMTL